MKNVFKIAALTAGLAMAMSASAEEKIAFIAPDFVVANHPIFTSPDSEYGKAAKQEEAKLASDNQALVAEDKKLNEEHKAIEAEGKKLKAEQDSIEKSMKAKIEQLEKDAPRLRSAEIKKRQDAINAEGKAFDKKVKALQAKESAFNKKVAAFQTKANAFQEKVAKSDRALLNVRMKAQDEVVAEINKAIEQVAKEKGYTLVLDSKAVMYTANQATNDITEAVLTAVGGKMPEKPAETPVKPAEMPAAPAETMKPASN